MTQPPIRALAQAQRERLAYLELRAYFTGELRRSDIEDRFGVKPAASTRDLASYRDLAPANLAYDTQARCYRPAKSFKPIFDLSTDRVLAWLLQGFGDGLDLKLRKAAPCEGPGSLVHPDLSILSAVTRAMCAKRALKVSYLSLSSGASSREVVPIALADNGLRWHVRAYDRAKSRFADFVLTRITKAKEIDGQVRETELLGADEQWARIVEMEVVPHPGVRWPQAIEADYGMDGGVLRLRARAALAGYPSVLAIANEQGMDTSEVTRVIYLAFLAPDLVRKIVEGRQPVGLGTKRLLAMAPLPLDWNEQRKVLGFDT